MDELKRKIEGLESKISGLESELRERERHLSEVMEMQNDSDSSIMKLTG